MLLSFYGHPHPFALLVLKTHLTQTWIAEVDRYHVCLLFLLDSRFKFYFLWKWFGDWWLSIPPFKVISSCKSTCHALIITSDPSSDGRGRVNLTLPYDVNTCCVSVLKVPCHFVVVSSNSRSQKLEIKTPGITKHVGLTPVRLKSMEKAELTISTRRPLLLRDLTLKSVQRQLQYLWCTSITPSQPPHTSVYTHTTHIPVDIPKYCTVKEEGETHLVSWDWRHIGRHCRLHSHYPVSHWIWRRIIP